MALELPKLAISTIAAKISTAGKQENEQIMKGKKENVCEPVYSQYTQHLNNIPFGIQFKDIMSIVAFIGTGKTNPCRLCSIGCASVAGKHSLPLHIAL